jgi:hypothetical protein
MMQSEGITQVERVQEDGSIGDSYENFNSNNDNDDDEGTGGHEAQFLQQWQQQDVFTAEPAVDVMDRDSWDDHLIMKLYYEAIETHTTKVALYLLLRVLLRV